MDEQQMRAECAKIAGEWGSGGLAGDTIYEDLAVELAKRVQAAERERCAKLVEAMDTTGQDDYIETTGDLCEAIAARIRRA